MHDELSSFIIQEKTSVYDSAVAIDKNRRKIVFVCAGMKLLGSLTDGDIRRYILSSGNLSKSVRHAANTNPTFLTIDEISKAQHMIQSNPTLRGIPIVNENGEIVSIVFSEKTSVRRQTILDTPVVIMAGGKGTRLAPFTDVLPKPLIPVGDMTITEHIMERFIDYGCEDFTMIVNHKRELIKAYFSESPCKGNLRFIDEDEFRGTCGGLKLLDGVIDGRFFMTNCDILVDADYEDILEHHKKRGAIITLVCAIKKISVPYGTVEMDDDGNPVKIVEKPEYPLLTNTGMYVIEPSVLDFIPSDTHIHMTDLLQKLIDDGHPVGIYPIGEAGWMDMGQIDELAKMEKSLGL